MQVSHLGCACWPGTVAWMGEGEEGPPQIRRRQPCSGAWTEGCTFHAPGPCSCQPPCPPAHGAATATSNSVCSTKRNDVNATGMLQCMTVPTWTHLVLNGNGSGQGKPPLVGWHSVGLEDREDGRLGDLLPGPIWAVAVHLGSHGCSIPATKTPTDR